MNEDKSEPPLTDALLDPSIGDIGQSLRKELRSETRRLERSVEQAELQSRSLCEALGEFHNRADLIAISTSERTFKGFVEAWAYDYVSVLGQTTLVDISISAIDFIQVTERGVGRRIPSTTTPSETFAHHLSAHEDRHARVEIGLKNQKDTLPSRIVVVGQDHLVAIGDRHSMESPGEWVIPLSSIAFIVRSRKHKKRNY